MKKFLKVFAIITICCFIAGSAMAEKAKPVGTVTIKSTSIAIGVGVQWGNGVLTFKGKEYKFSVKGLSIVDLGISSLTVAGEVFGLTKLEDFDGNYMAGSAGVAIAGGAQVTSMKNQNGVVMELKSTQTGVKLTFAAEGIHIKIKK